MKKMTVPIDNETWIIEDGDTVIRKIAEHGSAILLPIELLIYCLWVADYGMRNAGDLETAADLFPDFQTHARRIGHELNLPVTSEVFSMTRDELERGYFQRFDDLCNEIRRVRHGTS